MPLPILKHYSALNSSLQWALISALIILFSCLSFSYLTHQQIALQLNQQSEQQAQQLTRHASLLLRNSLRIDDRVSANVFLNDWVNAQPVLSATLYNGQHQAIAEASQTLPSSDNDFIWIEQTITDQGQSIGQLRCAISRLASQTLLNKISLLMIVASFLVSLLAALLVYFIQQRRERHSQMQLDALLQLKDDLEPETITTPSLIAQVSDTTDCINQLIEKKKNQLALQQALNQFTSQKPLPGTNKKVNYHDSAILFIEVANLESLQQQLSAEELVNTLNNYYQHLSQAAKLYNGTIDRYQGDGIVMLFGFPEKHPRDADHCLFAARLFQGLLESLNHDLQLQQLKFKIAAHWGPVLIAPINSGSEQQQIHVIGDTLHWAAHLAHHSEEGKLLISSKLIEQLADSQVGWQAGPELSDLDKSAQATYWLESLPGKASALIERQVKHIASISQQHDA